MIPIRVSGPKNNVDTFALLDEGSTITLIDLKLARDIGVRGQRTNITLKGIGNRESIVNNSEKVAINILGMFGIHRIENAITIRDLNLPSQSLPEKITNHIKTVEKISVQPYDKVQPKILLGQDNCQLIVSREIREIKESRLIISRSLLGWSVHGPTQRIIKTNASLDAAQQVFIASDSCVDQIHDEDVNLEELIKRYFQLESFGVDTTPRPSSRHEYALRILSDTTQRMGKSWETGLLWREGYVSHIDSETTARKRLISLERRLDRDQEYAVLYYAEMNRFISCGYAVKADKTASRNRIWYLPHFGVQNINKPGKLRLVFDAAAKTEGVSLNDQLESGPDFLQSLPGVLLRFRQHTVAFKADIKDMFLKIKIRSVDRGAQRFLWRGDDRKKEPEVYEMTCLIFGAKSSPCSAIYVKDKNAASFSNIKPDAAKSIIKNSYMDDYLASCDTVQKASDMIHDVIEINSEANFDMHSWATNDVRVMAAVPKKTQTTIEETRLCDRPRERVLGLFWDTRTDELRFNVEFKKISDDILRGCKKPTKREVLRVIMSVFDPLGFLSPFTIKSKILMQKIWLSSIGWDDQLRDEENVGWVSWLKNLKDLNECYIPRCYTPANAQYKRTELHIFCDASLEAYAAVAYLRYELQDGSVHVALIMAKAKVAPLKPLSVPRLELQAALLGSRVAKLITEELEIKIDQRYLWSDSATILRWIRTEPRVRQVFVAHRLGEIGELTIRSEWRWVPSKQNPADSATRWSSDGFHASGIWFAGPDFLRKAGCNWPVEKHLDDDERKTIDNLEIRKCLVCVTTVPTLNLPITTRVLGWRGLIIAARRVRTAANRWLGKPREPLTVQSIKSAEEFWYREIQSECFNEERNAIINKQNLKKGSKIANLRPFMDEQGILRVDGRITKLIGVEFNNQPIILDSKHQATRFLIAEYHRRSFHTGSDAVINELRQKYYIVGLRRALRSLLSRCLTCRLKRGKPQNPVMSALPTGRVAYKQRPFTHCGVDYFGPMLVKVGRRREKRWGVLFTCLTTRAIHLELAHNLSASSVIMALQRLAARRGSPGVIYSDNGTNFRGASKELKNAIKDIDTTKQKEYALTKRIKWVFNPPDAPHMGGAWERLIRSVKISLDTILREQAPSEEVLLTLLTEVEHSVNSRPLTHVSIDPRDNEALTPNHFLIGTSSGEIHLGRYEAQMIRPEKQWRIAQAFANAFWQRWLREYLPSLLPRKRWNRTDASLEVGDIVLILDLQAPRNSWKRGTIVQVLPGSDGEVRVVKVRTSTGDYIRPARKIVKLLSAREDVQN